jgi:hypothetical protein
VSEPGAKKPTAVTPVAVTVEPAPLTVMLPATRTSVVCSVPPLVTASVPPSTSTKLPTVADPPLMVSPPVWQLHRLRSPPMFKVPVSVSVPAPTFVSEPLPPLPSIEPLTVVERSLLPTMSRLVPS